jgi:hypothetical protein
VKQGVRGSRPELIVALAYLIVRVLAVVGIGATHAQDTLSYLEVARLGPFSEGMLAGPRAPAAPLFYKLLGSDDLRVAGQVTLSVVCWLALAAVVAASITSRRLRLVALTSILLFSLAPQVTHWDPILLSESLTVSLTAGALAAWLWLVQRPSWRWLAVAAGVTLVWVFSRDTNAYLVACLGVAMLVAIPFVNRRRMLLVGATAMLVIAALSVASADGGATAGQRAAALAGGPNGSFGRTAEAYRLPAQQYYLFSEGRWEFPLLNVMGQRVLTDPDKLSYFQDHGMPVTPALTQMAGQYAPGRNGTFYRSPALAGFRQWLVDKGTSTYTSYLLTHPAQAAKAFTADPRAMLFADQELAEQETNGAVREPVRDFLPGPVERLFLDRSVFSLGLWLLLGGAALVLALTRIPRWTWAVPLATLLSTVPHMLVVWNGDSQELQRHSLLVGVMGRLGILLLLFLALDSPRRERPLIRRFGRARSVASP